MTALLAVTASGLYFLSDSTVALAQKGDIASRGETKGKIARADQLAFALRLGSASDYTVFGAKGVRNDGATITGKSGAGSDEASLGENGSGLKARSDLNKSLAMIKQLPCEDMEATLTGGTFAPGVYCAPSAALAGQMVLDAGGDSTGTFVFRIAGAMKSAENFRMDLAGDAKPGNVYFVADTVTLGPWNSVIGTVIARGSVDVGAGTSVNGRAFSKESEVIIANGASLALAEGYIQICKEAVGGEYVYQFIGLDGANRLVRFNSDDPGTIIGPPVNITGLPGINIIHAIDIRPSTGQLYGLGSNGRTYIINPVTGAAAVVGTGVVPGVAVDFIGFDFDPITDRIRVSTADTSPTDNHYMIDPNTGAVTPLLDLPENASAVGFSGNFVGSVTTTPYFISVITGGNPAADTLFSSTGTSNVMTNVGLLGFNANTINGFDIYGNENAAFAVLAAQGPAVGNSDLFRINLATGAATSLGTIPDTITLPFVGTTPLRLRGLTTIGSTATGATGLENRIFQFQINGGQIVEVPVGSCSQPIQVPEGNNIIQELIDGFFLNRPDRDPATGGTWFNRFRLVGVSQSGYLPGSGAPAGTGITATDLSTRRVGVNVPHASSNLPVILTFTNTFAIPAVIEICKYSANTITTTTGTPVAPGVGSSVQIDETFVEGFFDFTVNTNPDVRYTVPVGFCTGPIQVLVPTQPQPTPGPSPAPGTTAQGVVYVTELAEPGFTLETVTSNPANRLLGVILNQAIPNTNACIYYPFSLAGTCTPTANAGGGYAWGRVYEASTAADQTIFNFFNRTNPGIIKVCKIAGPGIPIGTRFVFAVFGRQAQSQFAGGTAILPGTDIPRLVTVNAGPPEQGGNCAIVSEDPDGPNGPLTTGGANTLFVVGTQAYVVEIDVLDDVPGVESGGFGDLPGEVPANAGDGPDTSPNSQVIVSRIRVNGSTAIPSPASIVHFNATGTLDPNPNLAGRQVIFRVNRGETVVEYTNILFRPTQLKVCKVAGTGIAVGTPFTFTITVDDEGGLVPVNAQNSTGPTFPAGSNPFTIPAGDPTLSAQGNCIVVDGPYRRPNPAQAPPLSFGTFRVGSRITVSETGAASSVVITTPTGPPSALTVDAANRKATLQLGYIGGFNELIFVNSAAAPVSTTGFSLAGRVMTPDGGGLRNAQVILTKADGTRMTVPTSSMGYYNFAGLANETYTVSVSSRRYRFTARSVDLSASLANVDFTGIE